MTINRTHSNANYSTDPTASDVGRFFRRRAMTTSEQREPVMTARTLPIEELYPSLFEEPRLPKLMSDAAGAATKVVTAVFTLLRRRTEKQR